VYPHWFHQCDSGSSILGQCGSGYMDFMTKICTILKNKKCDFTVCIKNCNIFIHRPLSSTKDVQVTGEGPPALESSKDSVQHFKNTSTLVHLSSFWGLFLPTWTDADPCGSGSTTVFNREIKRTCTVFCRHHGAGSLGRPL
jgi:hypothetical protein